MGKRQLKQGKFIPKHPDKYSGNAKMVIYRSSWELIFCNYLDTLAGIENSPLIEWSSEEIVIPYYFEVDSKNHRYYPDFYMKVRDKNKNEIIYIVEIKPYAETNQPTNTKSKYYQHQMLTYIKNQAKWDAAVEWCRHNSENGIRMEFKVLTEYELGIKKRT